jgi:peptidoglycan/LPS O-acetylase OafA/YrhL
MVESIQIKEQSNRRLVFLDFIRGIAALAVFFQHRLMSILLLRLESAAAKLNY